MEMLQEYTYTIMFKEKHTHTYMHTYIHNVLKYHHHHYYSITYRYIFLTLVHFSDYTHFFLFKNLLLS